MKSNKSIYFIFQREISKTYSGSGFITEPLRNEDESGKKLFVTRVGVLNAFVLNSDLSMVTDSQAENGYFFSKSILFCSSTYKND